MRFRCQHCDAELTRAPAGRDGLALVKGTVAIRGGRVETRCGECKLDTVLPLRILIDTGSLTRTRRNAP